MRHLITKLLLLALFLINLSSCLTLKGQVKTITYYGQALWSHGSTPTPGTVFKTIQVTYDGNNPVAIIRGMNKWKLAWDGSGEDYETYKANNYFSFNIADNKEAVVEIYNYNGMIMYASYTRTPTASYDGGGNYNGGYNGGSFNNGGYNNDNRSRSSNSDQLTCPDCHGSGKCTSCAGRGEKRFDGRLSDCAICNGRGTCRLCYGRGWIR